MPGILKTENQLQWACRILMTVDVFLILIGYIESYQVQHQLVTPLIPPSTIYEIYHAQINEVMTVCSIWAGIFLVGLWFYSFKKTRLALILFGLPVIWSLLAILIR